MHEKTGLKITLYVYEEYADYNIANIPQRFKKELIDNSDWLQIGFHAHNQDFDKGRDSMSLSMSYNALKTSKIGRGKKYDCITIMHPQKKWIS